MIKTFSGRPSRVSIRITVVVLLLPVVIGSAYLYVSYWSSLDWDYRHSNLSESLPDLVPSADDGLYQIYANQLRFRSRVAGFKNSGDNVIMLHGFPESSIMWTPLMEELAQAGYRVIAFDQRGYSPGARPETQEAYTLAKLESDVSAVADAAGFKNFHLIGHDWGAAVAWAYAAHNPERLHSLTTLSIPHTGLFFKAIVTDPEQAKRSEYMNLLRKPWVPEYRMLKSELAFLRNWFNKLPHSHEEEYVAILSEPGALRAALNWYRANNADDLSRDLSLQEKITVPTLFLYGAQDMIAAPHILDQQSDFVAADYRRVDLDAKHNLMQQATDDVIANVVSHLRAVSSSLQFTQPAFEQ